MSIKASKHLLKHKENQKHLSPYYECMKFSCSSDMERSNPNFTTEVRHQNLDLLYSAIVLKTMHHLDIFDTLNMIYQQKS